MRNDRNVFVQHFLFGLDSYFIGKSLYVKEVLQNTVNQLIIYFVKNSLT